jgi:hypothetical protein
MRRFKGNALLPAKQLISKTWNQILVRWLTSGMATEKKGNSFRES